MAYRIVNANEEEVFDVVIPDYSYEDYSFEATPTIPEQEAPADSMVTTIEGPVFADCVNITSVTLPSSIQVIRPLEGNELGVFEGCMSLESINLEDCSDLYEIGGGVFKDCTALVIEHLNLSGVNSILIGDHAFEGTKIERVTLNPLNNSTSIGSFAFNSCSDLVYFGERGLLALNLGTFQNCSSLEELVLDNELQYIDVLSLKNCRALNSIEFDGTIEEWNSINIIGDWESANLDSRWYNETYKVHCNDGWTPLIKAAEPGLYVNGEYTSWDDLIEDGNITVTEVSEDITRIDEIDTTLEGELVLPSDKKIDFSNSSFENSNLSSIKVKKLYSISPNSFKNSNIENFEALIWDIYNTSIPISAFEGCSNLTRIYLPSTVNYINDNAFKDCSSLNTINLSNITVVGKSSFENSGIHSVEFGSTIPTFDLYSFKGCANLNEIDLTTNIPQVVEIPAGCFENSGLETVLLQSGAILGEASFKNCSDLSSIDISNATYDNGTSMFEGCSSLVSLSLPNKEYIDEKMFKDCSSLESITVNQNTKVINPNAFENCNNLVSINLNNINTINPGAFKNCSRLNISNINNLKFIGEEAFSGCNNSSIVLPNTVETIEIGAFRNNINLTSFTINEGIERIEANILNGCSSLTSLVIPDSVIYMNTSFLSGCSNLTSITFNGPDNDWYSIIKQDLFSSAAIGLNSGWFDGTYTVRMVNGQSYIYDKLEYEYGLYYGGQLTSWNDLISTGKITVTSGEITAVDSNLTGRLFIHKNISSIGTRAFQTKPNIRLIALPENIDYIGEYAFNDCGTYGIETLYIPACSTIGKNAFYNVGISSNKIKIKMNTIYRGGIKTDILNNELFFSTEIEKFEVKLPVKTINSRVFGYCHRLTSLTLPNSLQTIYAGCLNDCYNLTEINFKGTISNWNNLTVSGDWSSQSLNAGWFNGTYKVHCIDGDTNLVAS